MSAREILVLEGAMLSLPPWGELKLAIGSAFTAHRAVGGEWSWRIAWEPANARVALERVEALASLESLMFDVDAPTRLAFDIAA